jgi:hypothetical protein
MSAGNTLGRDYGKSRTMTIFPHLAFAAASFASPAFAFTFAAFSHGQV